MTKVLVIEDESSIRESIVDALEYSGYEVETASDGREGIDLARSCEPDLILCDIMMPIADGYEVRSQLNKFSDIAATPFIFLTAKATKTDQRKGMALGADDYLTKPFTAEELLDTVKSRLERHSQINKYNTDQIESLRNYLNSTIPHELRTPLNGILGFLSLLEDGLDTYDKKEIREMLSYMRRGADRLDNTIENFILYSQLQLIKHEPVILEKVHNFSQLKGVEFVIRHVAESYAFKANRTSDLKLNIEEGDVFIINDHAEKLVAMVVENAFKFSLNDTPVTVIGKKDGDFYTISVTNEGIGFTAEQIANIKAFNQFDRSKFEQQGAGVGLAIVKSIADIYKGHVFIDSEPEASTTVSISLRLLNKN
ncbi:MAG: response regulator [Anaerolineae bacterium]